MIQSLPCDVRKPDRRREPARSRIVLAVSAWLLFATSMAAGQVQVRHQEGLVRGFLVLRDLDGSILANGDLVQNVKGNRVTSRLVFHFKDGSLQDETAVFSQRGHFRLLSDHLVQKGPAFKRPMDLSIAASGQVTLKYTQDGQEKSRSDKLKIPPDIANGLLLTILKNIPPTVEESRAEFLVATPKPKLIKLSIKPAGEKEFTTGSEHRKVTDFVIKPDLGGITGLLADLMGKTPPDMHVWILEGEAPAFVRFEGPLAVGGPVWRIELVSPRFSEDEQQKEK